MLLFAITVVISLPCGLTEMSVNKTTLQLLFSNYDKDVRPNQGVGPLLIETDFYVESFANIAEANMEYTVFGYFRQYWSDKRLASKSQETIMLKGSTVEQAWKPDTYISNSRESNLHQRDSESETALFVNPKGDVFYSKGVKIVASCDMALEDFPMDTQHCVLTLGSYGYSAKDVIYKWKRDTVTVEKKQIAQFEMTRVQLDSSMMSYVSGNYTQLIISFSFKRRIGYYVIQVYLPDSLVVAISWIVFWLDQDDMGGRIGLGITTILTIMFLLGSVNMSLPRVSYPKAIDWFLIVSFLFVFLVLLECIFVYILRARKTDSKEDTDDKILDMKMVPIGDIQELAAKGDDEEPDKLLKKRRILQNLERFLSNSEPVTPKGRRINSKMPFLPDDDVENQMTGWSTAHGQKNVKALRRCRSCTISNTIDYASRFLFPLSFALFNYFYWSYYLTKQR